MTEDEICFDFSLPHTNIDGVKTLDFNCNVSGYEIRINGNLVFNKLEEGVLDGNDIDLGKLCFSSSDFNGSQLNVEIKYLDISGRIICTINQTINKPDFCKYDLRYEIIETTLDPCCKKIKFPYLCNTVSKISIDNSVDYYLAPDLEWSDKVIEFCDISGDPIKNIFIYDNNDEILCNIEIDFEICQEPCDECVEEMEDWIEITVDDNNTTCNIDECYVSLDFEIPEAFECYTEIRFSSTLGGVTFDPATTKSVSNFDITDYNQCIRKGQFYEVKLELFKGPNDTEPCEIVKSYFCEVYEDYVPCKPDCLLIPWEKQDDLHIPMEACPGCFMRISYYTRKANCNTEKYDIQITGIDKYGTNCSSTACDAGVTYREAIFAIIATNKMGFDDIPEEEGDPCFTTLRVSKSSCWTYSNVIDYYSPSGELISTLLSLRPCNSDCCLRRVNVCFENGELKVEALPNATTYPSCTNANHSYPPEFVNCFYTCDYLDNVNVTLKSGHINVDGINEFIKLQESINDPNNLIVNINVYIQNEDLNIEILETNGNNLNVKLFDMTGKQITMLSEKLSPKNNNFIIQLSELVNGTYIYNVEIDGILVKSDNIIIIK